MCGHHPNLLHTFLAHEACQNKTPIVPRVRAAAALFDLLAFLIRGVRNIMRSLLSTVAFGHLGFGIRTGERRV